MMNGFLLASTRALVARFRRRRPLRSGSLLITLLGDSVMPRGGAITLGSLIRLAQPFGLSERLVRTSVARVAQLGLLAVRREGRRSEYRLSALGRRRFAEATLRIYGAGPVSWDDRWTLLLLESPARLDERSRRELRWLGFGQLSALAFVHPSYSLVAARRRVAELGMRDCLALHATTGTLAADRRLLAASWDLHDLGRRYRSFIADFGAVSRALELDTRAHPVGPLSEPALLEAAFIVRTLLIHEYRKIHLRDPQLPPALLPPGWIGGEAYELCRQLYRALFGAAEQFLATHAQRLEGSLPTPARATYERFGGLPAPSGKRMRTRAVERAGTAVAGVP
jgi:phenylacetic acid degradation operon negative regulatory protein